MITINEPLCFSEIGKKPNQEDFLFPQTASESNRIFILCDGMGGHEKGEVASSTAATALGRYLSHINGEITEDIFKSALSSAYDALDLIQCDSGKTPGTTMTCLCINENSYLVAHIGDSRIYHIRPSLYRADDRRGGILYQSSDHSLVNDLLKAGELTEEEARVFPQRNVITRAMQPRLDNRYKADIYTFDDIRDGDYFFLCCDGILEQITNELLCEILSDTNLSNQDKLDKIKATCDGKTKDNYTCWLIQIDKVLLNKSQTVSHVIQADIECTEKPEPKQITVQTGKKQSEHKSIKTIIDDATKLLSSLNFKILAKLKKIK
jgi:protein phosphatase